MSSAKKWLIVLFALVVPVSFALGWFAAIGRASTDGALASLVNIDNCQGAACKLSKLYFLSNLSNADKGQPTDVDFAPFWKTWSILNQYYVDSHASGTAVNLAASSTSNQERVWGAISGMVSSLGDPYTVFMPPAEKTRFEEDIRGNFSGVGMELGVKDGVPTVIAPLPDSPAKKAGILAGDKILKVNGTSTESISLDDTIAQIRGEAGTSVTLTVLHLNASSPVEIKLTRAIINIPTLDTKTVKDKNGNEVFVISLYNFSSQASDLFRNAIEKFAKTGGHRLIIDLRDNPGGYLDAAVDMASWFLPEGKVVVRENYGAGKEEKLYTSAGYDLFNNKNPKLVILVDGGSASASEILAGALSEYKVATLVGEKTFGKGSVQELIPITADSSLKVTIARWLTPNGRSISQNGLDPDVTVKLATSTTAYSSDDAQFQKALDLLK